MEDRKVTEIAHYDSEAREWRKQQAAEMRPGAEKGVTTDVSGIEVMMMASYQAAYGFLRVHVPDKKVLDYGCGHGMHATAIAEMGAASVLGIDLSKESLDIARMRAEKAGVSPLVSLAVMDAEALSAVDNSFDIVFDGGTFSSLDLEKALLEIHRVLKPEGLLIGIETLGHNPLANLKRQLNKMRGRRTGWAADHILKMESFELMKKYFDIKELRFFHLLAMFVFPFRSLPGGKAVFKILDQIDLAIFNAMPFLKKYAFKTVFVAQVKK